VKIVAVVQELGLRLSDSVSREKAADPYLVRRVGQTKTGRKPQFRWVVSKADGKLVRVWR
jgi:hypothetical protein